ncbi:MAG: hypothetical protein EP299_01710 [Acidobacteria bacterium]|nr:MAG: hypothetical protein EP299_01710 [Acidobacteriota bacterium]
MAVGRVPGCAGSTARCDLAARWAGGWHDRRHRARSSPVRPQPQRSGGGDGAGHGRGGGGPGRGPGVGPGRGPRSARQIHHSRAANVALLCAGRDRTLGAIAIHRHQPARQSCAYQRVGARHSL